MSANITSGTTTTLSSTGLDANQLAQTNEMLVDLLKKPETLPIYVQNLMAAASQKTLEGDVAWSMMQLWALGKLEYVPTDMWNGVPAGWQLSEVN